MDKIFLHGMRVETLIGVYAWERQQTQALTMDLDIGMPERATLADDIADTVHYGEVCETVRRELAGRDFLLLETLAEYLAQLVLDDFGAQWVRVRIVKPGILPAVRETGVEIERRRSA
ncbi:dihydroneopterin aldolase [Kingella sp. SNUBH-2017]|uniref:dihydroneopterin aldolase n=1 Tax=Kingella sp. SNUBH-2017 TaxID=2994077 RepID=UPI00236405FC|nr:dihydroneopterin aldolase [Kingella sp. SNUBH-2017]MDD2183486.1 dihydroneopterin aldolase [Kingella sp. SNUBH-2017]